MADINASINTSNSSLVAALNPSTKIIPTTITSTGQTASIHTGNSSSVALGSAPKIIPTSVTNSDQTAASIGLGNVTNESKSTMFTSPVFSGTPTAPTATSGTNTTQIATTAFVSAALSSANVGSLAGLTDTTITDITDGELIVYDNSSSKYINKTFTELDIATATSVATKQSSLTFGISNSNSVLIDSTSVTSGDYAKFTASGLEGKSISEVKTDLSLDNVENKSAATIISEITDGDLPSTLARDSELTAHTSLTNNPHNVTRAQLNIDTTDSVTFANVNVDSPTNDLHAARKSYVDTRISSLDTFNSPNDRSNIVANINTNTSNISTNTSNISTNTSNISTLDSNKAPINSPTFTGTVSGVTAAHVGLGNVDNKSSATIRSEIVDSDIPSGIARDSEVTSAIATHAGLSNPHGITKSTISLGNVDNTSDASKPISTATQTALDLKAPINNPTFTGNLTANSNTLILETGGGGQVSVGGVIEAGQKFKVHGSAKVTGTLTVDNITVSGSGGLTLSNSPTIATHVVTKKYVDDEVAKLIDSAPGTLNTLNEIAAALNDSPAQVDNILSSVGTNTTNIATNTHSISTHTARTDNPHNVTRAQLSLDTTDNVTFATIDGTINTASQTNITELGTITTGTFRGTPIENAYVADLPTSKITSGVFDSPRIPNLSASKITSGTFDSPRIPKLSTSDITSGTFDSPRIPKLSTSDITSGTFADARIALSNITQHQSSLSIATTQLTGDMPDLIKD
jgi:hypothetical protein